MSLTASIGEVISRFPQFRVAFVVAENLRLADARAQDLDALIAAREDESRRRWADRELSEIPGIAAWRTAYKGFGIKKTSYRSSVERLVKRVKAGDRLPAVNTLVDIYNAVSLSHVFCCGADDLDKVTPPLAFRYAREGDSFVDMAEEGEAPEAPKPGEVVYADAVHVLCRRWNWRQDARSLITPATRRAVVTVQSNGSGDVAAAADDLVQLIGKYCGGNCRVVVLNATHTGSDL